MVFRNGISGIGIREFYERLRNSIYRNEQGFKVKIADLFAEVGFKFDTIKLHEVSKLIGDLNVASIITASSVAALGVSVTKVMEAAGKTSIKMLELKEASGLDPLRLQQLDVYFQEFGAGAGEATQALYNLNKLRLSVLQGTGNPQPFILTGLTPTTETLQLFDQIHQRLSDPQFLEKWAHSFATGAKSLNEMRAAWKDMIANQFGIPTSMLRGLDQSNEKWNEQYKILGLTLKELEANAEVHAKWVLAVNNLNIEIQKLVTNLAPLVTQVLKIADGFTQWLNKTQAIGNFFERLGVIKTYAKAGLMEASNVYASGIISAGKVGNELRRLYSNDINRPSNQTNNITLHVSSNTPEEFVKRFDAVWKRYIANADVQFGQQT